MDWNNEIYPKLRKLINQKSETERFYWLMKVYGPMKFGDSDQLPFAKIRFEPDRIENLAFAPLSVVFERGDHPVDSAVGVDDLLNDLLRLFFDLQILERDLMGLQPIHGFLAVRTDIPSIDFEH